MECLKALGLMYDEGPDIGGPYAPYRQSERLDSYKTWAEKLIKAGRAYADPYTPEEVQSFREQAQKQKNHFYTVATDRNIHLFGMVPPHCVSSQTLKPTAGMMK